STAGVGSASASRGQRAATSVADADGANSTTPPRTAAIHSFAGSGRYVATVTPVGARRGVLDRSRQPVGTVARGLVVAGRAELGLHDDDGDVVAAAVLEGGVDELAREAGGVAGVAREDVRQAVVV